MGLKNVSLKYCVGLFHFLVVDVFAFIFFEYLFLRPGGIICLFAGRIPSGTGAMLPAGFPAVRRRPEQSVANRAYDGKTGQKTQQDDEKEYKEQEFQHGYLPFRV
jgi:hypothetical protein